MLHRLFRGRKFYVHSNASSLSLTDLNTVRIPCLHYFKDIRLLIP